MKPYGSFQQKLTQFFTTSCPFKLFKQLKKLLQTSQHSAQYSATSLKVRFQVTMLPAGSDKSSSGGDQGARNYTCCVKILEVCHREKYCCDFSYETRASDEHTSKTVKNKDVLTHFFHVRNLLRNFVDATFHE